MSNFNFCQEKWLDDIIDIAVYKKKDSPLPVPQGVSEIRAINNVKMGDLIVGFSYTEKENYITAEEATMIAKVASATGPAGRIYSHEISVVVSGKDRELYNIVDVIGEDDCLIVLTCQDNSSFLCYTLDGSFKYQHSATNNNSINNEVKISLQSCSNWIDFSYAKE